MQQPSFLWHDYESFGVEPRRDRPAEFAALRTDTDFNPIAEPVTIRCQPTIDYLPDPDACRVTGIGPMQALETGLPEPQFAARVFGEMCEPQTCVVGYNNLRFDDEMTRHLFWRNFFDPYAREWQNGNSRFDMIDLMRAAYALRPHGLHWPQRDDGAPSFRLDELAPANGVKHEHAHSALADVEATLGLARKLRAAQPKLFEHALSLRDKHRVSGMLNWQARAPLVHVSQRFPAARGCLAIVVPLAFHPRQSGKIIVYDSYHDPAPLLTESPQRLSELLLLPGDAASRTPLGLKLVHTNKVPFLAPLSVLTGVDLARIALDRERCMANVCSVQNAPDLDRKVQEIFASVDESQRANEEDVDSALYSGFVSDADRRLCSRFRSASPEQMAEVALGFQDCRLRELAFRYRARHFNGTLSPIEKDLWRAYGRRQQQNGKRPFAAVLEAANRFDDAVRVDVLRWLELASAI